MIPSLIDKQDSFEIVRDKIAAILLNESASQQALAIAAAKNPDLWKLRVFLERSNPWEIWLNDDSDKSPIVNIWYDSSQFDKSSSNVVERQSTTTVYNIDIYGYGVSSATLDGHNPGDKLAVLESHRGTRLVRNIIMSGIYTYLDLRGLVWSRFLRNVTTFQAQQEINSVQHVVASRIALEVVFNEFAPQYEPQILEELHVDVCRKETGELYIEALYDYT